MNRCCASSMEEPLIIGVDDIEPLPPWEASNPKAATVPSLQELVCGVLASHLNCFESLDVLPEHLASRTCGDALSRVLLIHGFVPMQRSANAACSSLVLGDSLFESREVA